jgi:O-antigen/teichoic acid export membrane protein
MGFAFFVSIGNAAYWLLSYSDRWLLEFFNGPHAVGLYSVGYDLTGRTTMLFVSTFALALQPLSITTWEQAGRAATERFLSASTRIYLLFMLPATVGLAVLAGPLVRTLASPAYMSAASVVPFVAFAMLFFGLLDIAGRGLTLSKRPDIEARNFFIAGITNVVCNLLLIPHFGMVAAAFSTLLGYLVLFALHVISSRDFATWRFPWLSFTRIAAACGVMAALLLTLEPHMAHWNKLAHLGAIVSVGAVVYVVLIVGLREITLAQLRDMVIRTPPTAAGERA